MSVLRALSIASAMSLLGGMAIPAHAADVISVSFTVAGTVTGRGLDCWDDCDGITPNSLGIPPLGTPWTLSATVLFSSPVPDSGYYSYGGPGASAELGEFDGTFSLSVQGYGSPWAWSGWSAMIGQIILEDGVLTGFEVYEPYEWCGGGYSISNVQIELRPCGDYPVASYWMRSNNGQIISVNIQYVPEPATWAMLISGFGLAGATLRRRRALPQKS